MISYHLVGLENFYHIDLTFGKKKITKDHYSNPVQRHCTEQFFCYSQLSELESFLIELSRLTVGKLSVDAYSRDISAIYQIQYVSITIDNDKRLDDEETIWNCHEHLDYTRFLDDENYHQEVCHNWLNGIEFYLYNEFEEEYKRLKNIYLLEDKLSKELNNTVHIKTSIKKI